MGDFNTDIIVMVGNRLVMALPSGWLWETDQNETSTDHLKQDLGAGVLAVLRERDPSNPMKLIKKAGEFLAEKTGYFERQGLALEEMANGLAAFIGEMGNYVFRNKIPYKSNNVLTRVDELAAMIKEAAFSEKRILRAECKEDLANAELPKKASERFGGPIYEEKQKVDLDHVINSSVDHIFGQRRDPQISKCVNLMRLLAFAELFKVVKPSAVYIKSEEVFTISQRHMHDSLADGGRKGVIGNMNYQDGIMAALLNPVFEAVQYVLRDGSKIDPAKIGEVIISTYEEEVFAATKTPVSLMEKTFEDVQSSAALMFRISYVNIIATYLCDLTDFPEVPDVDGVINDRTIEIAKGELTKLLKEIGETKFDGNTLHEQIKSAALKYAYLFGHDVSGNLKSRERSS